MLNPIWLLSIAILWYKKKPLFRNYIFFLSKRLGLLKFDCTCHVSIVILERSVGRILSFMPSPMSVIASKFLFSYYFLFIFISIYSPSSLDNGGSVKARFHYERGKKHSLFVLLLFFALASILTARFNRRSIKERKNALFHARSGNGPLYLGQAITLTSFRRCRDIAKSPIINY